MEIDLLYCPLAFSKRIIKEVYNMAKCVLCDKKMQTGHRISINRSQVSRRANRVWKPNIKKVKINENGTVKTVSMCTRCLRSQKFVRAI